MKLGECIEAYRKENKLTYRQLAKEIGVDHAVLFKLRKHPTTGTENTMRLLNWLWSWKPKED